MLYILLLYFFFLFLFYLHFLFFLYYFSLPVLFFVQLRLDAFLHLIKCQGFELDEFRTDACGLATIKKRYKKQQS